MLLFSFRHDKHGKEETYEEQCFVMILLSRFFSGKSYTGVENIWVECRSRLLHFRLIIYKKI